MERMRVRGCDDVWPCFMNRSMNGEGGLIHRTLADHDLALAVDEQQVRYAYPRKVSAKGIDPEMIGPFGVARGNVASEALCKAMAGKEAKRAGQPFLTMTAFFCQRPDREGVIEPELARGRLAKGEGGCIGESGAHGRRSRVQAAWRARDVSSRVAGINSRP